MFVEPVAHLRPNRRGEFSRRRFLQFGLAGLAGSGLLEQIRLHAGQLKKEGRSLILVWLAGAPSQLDTWDPKPGTETGGTTKAIRTAVPGIQISEHFPRLAKSMKDVAVLRSIVGKEAAHERGTYHLHTGRRMTGTLKFPNFGSVVAEELGDPNSDIPNFISIGQTLSSGFLGVKVAPFIVNRPGQLPANVAAGLGRARVNRRLALLKEQDADFAAEGAEALVEEHQALYAKANQLMRSPRLKAFQLDDETEAMKSAYGKTTLGQGLLVARRLVEVGVPFVEVRRGGWDMHNNLYQRLPACCGDVDRGLSQLLADLGQRGMLEKTLVVCMGEFGRTPKMNQRDPAPGRDHWARNFNLLLAGGGIRGGRTVGQTNADGTEIAERPVSVEDLFQTFCKVMGIHADLEIYTPAGRPLRIVDGGEPIKELFA